MEGRWWLVRSDGPVVDATVVGGSDHAPGLVKTDGGQDAGVGLDGADGLALHEVVDVELAIF